MEEVIYDKIRKLNVKALPEEVVRQHLLNMMIDTLGYPLEMLSVEVSLRDMPHMAVSEERIPDRRADIVCYTTQLPFSVDPYPLLMVECKAVALSEQVIQQVVGYNYYVRSCFVAIANGSEIRTGWFDDQSQSYSFVDGLPTYIKLIQSFQS